MEGSQKINLEFLAGGGEMGERIRAFDWSKTPLGPPEMWEQSLKTCVRIVLTSRQPMFVWWGKELINIYNDPYKAIVGGKHPKALGQPAAVVWKEIWENIEPRAETAMRTNEGTYDEALLLIMERYGYAEETYYTFSYSPVPGDQGGTNGIICANTDDTQRIVNERALKTLRDLGVMTANRKSAEEIYQISAEVLAQNNRDFPFTLMYTIENEGKQGKLVAHSGITLEAAVFPEIVEVENPQPLLHELKKVVETNKSVVIDLPKELRNGLPTGYWPISASKLIFLSITNTGRNYPFAVMVSALNPYRQFDENYQSLFELFTDQLGNEISNLYAYEEERKRAEALAEIDKAKTTFFSNISHEFRTPLTLILGPLEDFLNGVNSSAHQKENIEAAHRNAIRLLRLVNSLLDFSRIEAGRVKATFQPVNLASLTAFLAENFRSVIEKAGISFKIDCGVDSFPVYLDKEMWEKIVLNLVSNAFKYTLKGEISVKLLKQGENAVLSVEDTGVGIPEKELPRMFERFHRIENSGGRTHEGTGIGLSLVYELVKLHHGTIKVESVEGKGSTFTVSIPLGKDHLDAGQIVSAENGVAYHSVSNAFLTEAATLVENSLDDNDREELLILTDEQKNRSDEKEEFFKEKETTVLLVDDNADMLLYVKQLLDKEFKVVTAKHGKQALEKMSDGLPDLIVSDMMMPVMDGRQLLKTVKNNPITQHIPMILLSARAGEESKVEGIDAGADDYLVKPFSAKELLARVRSQIKIRKIQTAAEQHIRHLFMQAPVSIVIYQGPDFIIELINDKALELWGRKREDVLGKSLFELFSEAPMEALTLHTQVFETGERHIGKGFKATFDRNGELYTGYFDFVYEPLRDLEGKVTGIIVTAHEVTDEIKAQTKIRESQERLRLAIELANIGTWDYDPVQEILSCSERIIEIVGFSSEEKINLSSFLSIIEEEDERKRVVQVIGEVMTSGSDGNYEIEYDIFNRQRKTRRTVRVFGKALFNENSQPYRLIGTAMDITEEKKYKEELEQEVAERTSQLEEKNRELQQQNDFVETILNSSVDVMSVFDRDFRYVTLNQASYGLYGIKRKEDIVGRNILEVFPQVADSGMYNDLKKAMLGQTVHDPNYKSKVLNRDFENFYIPLKNQQQEVYGVLAIGHDVSRIVEAAQKLEEKNAALLKSNNDLEQFAHVASHDLQEPLRKIQTFSELLAKNLNQEAEAKKYLAKIEYSAARMQTLIRDVLNYSRLSKAEERKVDTNLNQLLETIKIDFELLIEQKKATIITSELPVIKAIPLQISQLFSNLLSNSLKFSRTVPATIIQISSRELTAEEFQLYPQLNATHSHLVIEFKDNGIGFDPEYKQQIFTIFQRLHDKQSYSGTGIGLALCKKIVENHQGIITADSEPNKGAIFTIILPVS